MIWVLVGGVAWALLLGGLGVSFLLFLAASLFLASILVFCLGALYFVRARSAYAHANVCQREAIAAQQEALDLAANAREFIL